MNNYLFIQTCLYLIDLYNDRKASNTKDEPLCNERIAVLKHYMEVERGKEKVQDRSI